MTRLKAMPGRLGGLGAKLKPAPKTAERFYESAEWRAMRARLERERGRRCEEPGCTTPRYRVILDHVRERKDGGADLDPANLKWRCFNHHQAKTAAVRRRRASGRG